MLPRLVGAVIVGLAMIAGCDSADRPAKSADREPADTAGASDVRQPAIRLTEGRSIWLGSTGVVGVDWSDSDLVVVGLSSDQDVLFSARREALAAFDEFARTMTTTDSLGDLPTCTYRRRVRLLSAVGPYVSYRFDTDGFCEGSVHPFGEIAYRTIDAGDAANVRTASLRDIFDDAVLYDALARDPIVRQALDSSGVREDPPRTLDALVAWLGAWTGGCEYAFPPDMLSRFAFYAVNGDSVSVRVALTYGCEAARGNLTQLGLRLPTPPALARALQRASGGDAGILMNQTASEFGGAWSTFDRRYPGDAERRSDGADSTHDSP